MPRLTYSLTLALVTFLIPMLGFSQSDSLTNSIISVRQVVIGNKPSQKAEAVVNDTVKANFPGSITVIDSRDNVEFQIIPADDEVIAQRIKGLENIMPMPYNEHVKKYVDYFLYKRPNFVKQMLERKEFYFPIFEQYLAKHGIPDEMKYLALLESGLNPTAISHAKAVGLWQFMSPTGKEYGLKINDYTDERMHIEKSTEASFRYLTWLYNYFHDWELALASYNTGPGNLRRAIRKSGGKTDYWELHNYIHRDTRAYVPQWEALNYLMNYSSEHGIFPDYSKTVYPVATENLLLDGPLNLETFAALNYLDFKTLKLHNPHLIKNDIPSHARNIEIKLPLENYAYFNANRSCILDSACVLSVPVQQIASITNEFGTFHIERKQVKEYYRVRPGDYLGKIASNNGVSISQIKKWNNMRSNTVMKGQRLVLYKTESVKVYDSPAHDKPSPSPKSAVASTSERSNVKVLNSINKTVASKTDEEEINVIKDSKPSNNYQNVTKTIKRYHYVRSGDNLTMLARQYGTTINKLKEWNNLSSNGIQKGQRLAYYTTIIEKVYNNVADNKSTIKIHTVQPGDTLWAISQKYGYTMSEIKKLNGMTDNTVKIGQKLKV
jgi:membrane-bound lytic murein transglycosylase D